MTASFAIQRLSAKHDRTAFDCGVPALNRYFHEQITQDVRRLLAAGFVALDGAGTVAGFYTLAATSLPLTDLAAAEARRLPRYPLLPAVLVGRLALDLRFRGRALGSGLLVDAIERAGRAEPAVFAIVVDAKDDAAAGFYGHHGFQVFASRPLSFYLPMAMATRRLRSIP